MEKKETTATKPAASSPKPSRMMTDIGTLLKNTWDEYVRGKATYIVIPLIGMVVNFLLGLVMVGAFSMLLKTSVGTKAIGGLLFLVIIAAIFIVSQWMTAAMIYAAIKGGDKVSWTDALKSSKALILPLIWVGLLTQLMIWGGTLLLIVPGIIFGVWLSMAAVSMVAENQKGLTALSRSRDLVKGYGWAVFGRLLILIAIAFGAALITMLTGPLSPFINLVFQVFYTGFTIIYVYLMYKDLLAIKGQAKDVQKQSWMLVFICIGLIIILVGAGSIFFISKFIAKNLPGQPNFGNIEQLQGPEDFDPSGFNNMDDDDIKALEDALKELEEKYGDQ